MARQETLTVAGERLIYTVRRSRRAKHLLLHVDEAGEVEVVVPWWVPLYQAAHLIRDKHRWLRREQERRLASPPRRSWQDGSQLPLWGEGVTLRVRRELERQRAHVAIKGRELKVTLPAYSSVRAAVEAWYARQARTFFTEAAEAAAEQLNVAITRISVGNHKTQWGSCSKNGRLSFNWRLLLGPTWVARYVVAHEVAHLVHHNHSARYWAVVGKLYPDYTRARRWLRKEAQQLRWG